MKWVRTRGDEMGIWMIEDSILRRCDHISLEIRDMSRRAFVLCFLPAKVHYSEEQRQAMVSEERGMAARRRSRGGKDITKDEGVGQKKVMNQ